MFTIPTPVPAIDISISSQGVSKGLRQTEGPQVLVRPEVGIGPLVLLGYFKNVDAPADSEIGIGGGVRRRIGGFDLAASALYKWNPGLPARADRDALELNATASRRFGPFTPRLSVTWSPNDLGATRASLYVEGGASLALLPHMTLSANLARRTRDGSPDYTAFNAGLSYALGTHLVADLRYYDTAQSRLGPVYRPRVVASLRMHF